MAEPDFIGFLTERLNEDEAYARNVLASLPPEWGPFTWEWTAYSSEPSDPYPYCIVHERAPTPARVLAEVEAKRQLLRLHDDLGELRCAEDEQESPCPTLLVMAIPYQDHPQFQPEWR